MACGLARCGAWSGILMTIAAVSATGVWAQGYTPKCQPPFEKQTHAIDDPHTGCAVTGNPTASALSKEQNTVKNDFCAAQGQPTTITFDVLRQLQSTVDERFQQAHLAYGRVHGKETLQHRSVLPKLTTTVDGKSVTLGEGSFVQLVAFVNDAHPSDLGQLKNGTETGGESVNCNLFSCEENDIHIELTDTDLTPAKPHVANKCTTATAEIAPHFRPDILAHFSSPEYDTAFRSHPVRFRGQLFFDMAHQPCANGKAAPGAPARFTSWEIHPVYGVDICKATTLAQCKVDDSAAWDSLEHAFAGQTIHLHPKCVAEAKLRSH